MPNLLSLWTEKQNRYHCTAETAFLFLTIKTLGIINQRLVRSRSVLSRSDLWRCRVSPLLSGRPPAEAAPRPPRARASRRGSSSSSRCSPWPWPPLPSFSSGAVGSTTRLPRGRPTHRGSPAWRIAPSAPHRPFSRFLPPRLRRIALRSWVGVRPLPSLSTMVGSSISTPILVQRCDLDASFAMIKSMLVLAGLDGILIWMVVGMWIGILGFICPSLRI